MFAGNPVHTVRTTKSCYASEHSMAPIAKENEILTVSPETAARPSVSPSAPADTAIKQQPVALEVAVTVNGARTVQDSDKREPFSESTKTVLVFGNGAVIRLASSVTPGQLLFLTNEKTKKEVVCQVVKSKNYRNVSGYVELEFTEPVVGFWGMRFPGDRIGSGPQPVVTAPPAVGSPVSSVSPLVPRPVAPRIEPPVANIAPKILEQKPVAPVVVVRESEPKLSEAIFVAPPAPATDVPVSPRAQSPVAQVPATPASLMPDLAVNAPPVKPVAPVSSTFDLPRTPETRASIFAPPPQASAAPPAVDLASLFPVPEASPAAPPAPIPPQAPSAGGPETEALKQQTARLQEQLSSLLFMEPPTARPVQEPPAAPVTANTKPSDPFAEILQFAKSVPAPVPAKPAEPAKLAPHPVKSLLDEEELKIPSWLEPLARNAAAPASTQELIEREKTKRLAEHSSDEESAAETTGVVEEERAFELQAPNFGSELRIDEHESTVESGSRKSGKGILFAAIAAGALLLAGGGAWYFRQPSSDVHAVASTVTKQAPAASVPAETSQPQGNTALQTNPPAQTGSATVQTNPSSNPSSVEPAGAALASVSSKQVIPNAANRGTLPETSASSQPAPAQPKKSSLGEIRLATPKVTKRGNTQDNGEAEAGLAMSGEQPESNGGALGAGLAANTKQPAAPEMPLPVGGDVKQAKLVSSVPPVYPVLAKNQHVSGDVRVDALIDATGRVTTMKIVSGPTLLHQAAMDALRQWKYQPASLNGSAVQMHLTVTLQFRLQ
jgi:TonB family protein